MSLLLNAIFHHSLMMIPQQEIPGSVPDAYVMRHPETGNVEVWWSPCPSRECPEEEELDIVVDQCLDHCLLLEQNPKIETMVPPTSLPIRTKEDKVEIDNLNFHLSKRKALTKNRTNDPYSSSTTPGYTTTPIDYTTNLYCKFFFVLAGTWNREAFLLYIELYFDIIFTFRKQPVQPEPKRPARKI